jgi:hypothetical protein
MEETPMKVTLTEPATIAGAYVVREQQDDGTLVLRPEASQEVIEQFANRPLSGAEMLESLERLSAASHIAARRPPAREAVGRVVCWYPVQHLVQQPTLDALQPRLGALDDPRRTAASRQPRVAVVAQLLVGDRALEPADVGQPRELAVADLQMARDRAERCQLWDGPGTPAHGQLGPQPAPHPGRRCGGGYGYLPQLQSDVAGELARSIGGPPLVRRENVAYEQLDPGRPRLEHLAGACDKSRCVPRPGEEGVGQAGRQRRAGATVHGAHSMATPPADRSVPCAPGPAPLWVQRRARDALLRSDLLPRGSPGEGGAPAGASTRLGQAASPRQA